jgi:hypothetical protein
LKLITQLDGFAVDEKFFAEKKSEMVAALRNSRKKNNNEKIKKKKVTVKKVAKESLKPRTRSTSKTIQLNDTTDDDASRIDENNPKIVEFEEDEKLSENGGESKLDENGDESISVLVKSDTDAEQVLQKLQVFEESTPVVFHEESPKTCSHCGVTDFTNWRNGPSDFPCLCITCNLNWKRGKILLAYKADSPTPNLHTIFLQESEPAAVVPESFFASFFPSNEKATPHTPAYYVSDFAVPLPKKFACPTISPERSEESYFYPCPTTLTDPEDRWEYLVSKLEKVDSCQLAQMLLLLDSNTRNEFDNAIKIKKDASLDVSCLDNETWSLLCGLFVQH